MTAEETKLAKEQATKMRYALNSQFVRNKERHDGTLTIALPVGTWNLIDHLLKQIEED
jgi:hypothetical protein